MSSQLSEAQLGGSNPADGPAIPTSPESRTVQELQQSRNGRVFAWYFTRPEQYNHAMQMEFLFGSSMDATARHSSAFSRALLYLANHVPVDNFKLSLTKGRWVCGQLLIPVDTWEGHKPRVSLLRHVHKIFLVWG